MATPYVKQTWIDNNGANPLSAARLGVIETGIFDAHYRPCVAVFGSAALSIPNATTTIITFNSETYDTDAMHSTVSNTGRLTAPVAGKYHITGRLAFAANGTGTRQLFIRLNGTTTLDEDVVQAPNAANICSLFCSVDYPLAAADFVELCVTQTSGGALNTSSGLLDLRFSMFVASY